MGKCNEGQSIISGQASQLLPNKDADHSIVSNNGQVQCKLVYYKKDRVSTVHLGLKVWLLVWG